VARSGEPDSDRRPIAVVTVRNTHKEGRVEPATFAIRAVPFDEKNLGDECP
jgi:hypothetical protein